MSQDIRKFFPLVQQKKRPPPKVVVSDDDIIEESPVVERKKQKTSRKLSPSKLKPTLKPANALALFGTSPVKQSKVVSKTKDDSTQVKPDAKQTKRDERFSKTLADLDDEMDVNLNDLDKTIDETLKEDPNATSTKPVTPKTPKTHSNKRSFDDLNSSAVLTDQEKFERRQSNYLRFKNRPEPANKGNKEMPEGTPKCLSGLCFLKTGVLDSLDSETLNELVVKHGGRTVKSVSKKVDYIVVGTEPGESKMEKARQMRVKIIDEDDLLDLILTKSGKPARYKIQPQNGDDGIEAPSKRRKISVEESPNTQAHKTRATPKKDDNVEGHTTPKKEANITKKEPLRKSPRKLVNNNSSEVSPKKMKATPEKKEKITKVPFKTPEKKDTKPKMRESPRKLVTADAVLKIESRQSAVRDKPVEKLPKVDRIRCVDVKPEMLVNVDGIQAWTEKYKPTNLKEIVGQAESGSNMHRLLSWLTNWSRFHGPGRKATAERPSPWAKNDSGAYFKAAMLSGPPGVGKTTTATLVAQELGYDVVEFNASDTRSKKLLHEEILQLLTSKSLSTFFKDGSAPTTKHVLLMDEVDGMSGNEDRGGMQELISLIKTTNVPIICMCNDRQHPKIRSLANYCFDLRFGKIKPQTIKGRMMSICHKEGIKISSDALMQMIISTGNDIRQTINHLAMWSASSKDLSNDAVEQDTSTSKKDTVLGPWEVVRKVFSSEEHKTMRLDEKSKLFFYDYNIASLFVQENYLQVEPDGKNALKRAAMAADCISRGDVIEAKIRSGNNWSLMDSQAFHASVLPGHYMSGRFKGQINFPAWLGKNSKTTKFRRMAGELQHHMRMSASTTKDAVNLDYVYALRDGIVKPLIKSGLDGVDAAVQVMRDYNLLREDLDSILELAQWSGRPDPMARVESKIKAAFTRTYNKDGPVLPYAIESISKKKTVTKDEEMFGENGNEHSDTDEDKDDIKNDGMIKEKKKPASKAKKTAAEPSTSKKPAARGRAKKAK